MKLEKSEIENLIEFTKTYRSERERRIRRVRRNRDVIQERYDRLPEEVIYEDGMMSPNEEIEALVRDKAIATEFLRKFRKQIKEIDEAQEK